MRLLLVIFLCSCTATTQLTVEDTNVTRSADYQQEIDAVLLADKENKVLEEQYLREIAIAEDNNDEDAYKFYLNEYIAVPRIPLEQWMYDEPNFYPRKSAKQVVLEYRQEN